MYQNREEYLTHNLTPPKQTNLLLREHIISIQLESLFLWHKSYLFDF